jgi:hypothetical protein
MAVADFFSAAVGCPAWAHAIAAPQPIAATPQTIANRRIKNSHSQGVRTNRQSFAAPYFRLNGRAAPSGRGSA